MVSETPHGVEHICRSVAICLILQVASGNRGAGTAPSCPYRPPWRLYIYIFGSYACFVADRVFSCHPQRDFWHHRPSITGNASCPCSRRRIGWLITADCARQRQLWQGGGGGISVTCRLFLDFWLCISVQTRPILTTAVVLVCTPFFAVAVMKRMAITFEDAHEHIYRYFTCYLYCT